MRTFCTGGRIARLRYSAASSGLLGCLPAFLRTTQCRVLFALQYWGTVAEGHSGVLEEMAYAGVGALCHIKLQPHYYHNAPCFYWRRCQCQGVGERSSWHKAAALLQVAGVARLQLARQGSFRCSPRMTRNLAMAALVAEAAAEPGALVAGSNRPIKRFSRLTSQPGQAQPVTTHCSLDGSSTLELGAPKGQVRVMVGPKILLLFAGWGFDLRGVGAGSKCSIHTLTLCDRGNSIQVPAASQDPPRLMSLI